MKNEAHNLSPFLQSMKGCFDEIHLVDTGSTDNTLEFCSKINEHIEAGNPDWAGFPKLQIHHFEWVHDFAKARAYSFSKATTDYVFWADLDDSLSSAEEFIKWRDTVMHAAHYWVALYNYAYNSKGQPECQFIRERVIKRNFGFEWRYFVHEGLLQVENRKFWANKATTWTINHRRTEEDRKADQNRNISLFEKHDYDSLPARMKFYYGKELFENGFPEKSGKPLHEALLDKSMEFHDRVMCLQYAAQSALHAGAYETAVNLCHQSLQLVPSRAENWCLIADCYVKQGNLAGAKLAHKYALQCTPDTMSGTLVTHQSAYYEYPHLQLTQIALSLGDFEGAANGIEALKKIDHASVQEFEKKFFELKELSQLRSDLPKIPDVIITCPPNGIITDWDENSLKTKGHGGSETAAIEVAKIIKKKTGRAVKVFQPRQRREIMESGVEYIPSTELAGYIKNVEPHAHIAWRHSVRLTKAQSFIWCHDLLCPNAEKTSEYDKIFALSGFHADYLHQCQGIPKEKISLLVNGLNPEDLEVGEVERNKLKVIFSSSPDRGLDRAIKIVEKAREIYGLDLELHSFYGFENMKKGGLKDMAESIEAMIVERPWVKHHGFVNKKELMKHFKEASVWVYPANFIETYCITAIEALCCGAYPVVRDMGALKYTMKEAIEKEMCDVLDVDCETDDQVEVWATAVGRAILEEKWRTVDIAVENYTWEKTADIMIKEMAL